MYVFSEAQRARLYRHGCVGTSGVGQEPKEFDSAPGPGSKLGCKWKVAPLAKSPSPTVELKYPVEDRMVIRCARILIISYGVFLVGMCARHRRHNLPLSFRLFMNGNNGSFTNTDDIVVDLLFERTIKKIISEMSGCENPILYTAGPYTYYLIPVLSQNLWYIEVFVGGSCFLSVYYNVLSASFSNTLNGVNGEATNTDDVSAKQLAQQQREREFKESKNHQHKKNSTSAKPTKKDEICKHYLKGTCSRGEHCRFQHPPDLEGVKAEKIVANGKCGNILGVYYTITKDGIVKLETDSGYDVDDEMSRLDVTPLPHFVMFARSFGKHTVTYNVHLLKWIQMKLGILPNEGRNYAVLTAFVSKYLHIFPANPFLYDMIAVYAFKNTSKTTETAITTSIPYTFGISVNIIEPAIRPLSFSPCKMGYKFNESWKIVKSNGFHLQLTQDYPLVIVDDVCFETQKFKFDSVLPVTDRNFRQFFEFTPRNRFLVYAPCAQNMCGALSRYFKSVLQDENDHVRKLRQFQLLRGVDKNLLSTVADLCQMQVYEDLVQVPVTGVACDGVETVVNYVCTTRFGRVYKISHGKSLFLRTLDKYVPGFWVLTFLYFLLYMYYVWGSFFNSIVEYIYTPLYNYYDRVEILRRYIQLPLPKRLEYGTYVSDQKSLARIISNSGEFETKYKWEFGKVGKEGRGYATGAHLALSDQLMAPFLKWIFKREILVDSVRVLGTWVNFTMQYCDTQERYASDKMFNEALNLPTNTVKLFFFSDDGFIVSNFNGKISIYETDFSSCDASNGFPIFAGLVYLARHFFLEQNAVRVIEQCARNTTVRNPDNKQEFATLQPETFFELSGNLGTTLYNNLAEVGFMCGLVECFTESGSLHIDNTLIQSAAYKYGWKVTIEQRASFNAATFLKRAYNMKVSWLVYGAILRSFGSVDGVPTAQMFGLSRSEFAKTNNTELTEILIKQRVLGLSNEPSSPVINALRVRAGLVSKYSEDYDVSIDDLNERYNSESWEWAPLIDAIINLQMGDVITLPVLEKIYKVDYGVEIIEGSFFDVMKSPFLWGGHTPLNDVF